MRGNFICLLLLYLWIPIILHLFSRYKARDAAFIAYLAAILFLPMDALSIPLIIYNKMTATGIGVMLAIKMHDEERLENFSFHPVDIPFFMWMVSGLIASVTNGLGVKDGIQESFNTFTLYGVPYLVGRLYCSDPEGIKQMCRFFILGGLLYIPLILFELKMSPQAHAIVYGYMQHDFSQVMRGNGYRPMVFMQHGIMLGTYMSMSALIAMWCIYAKVFPEKKMWGIPTILIPVLLIVISIACKSSGAIGLLFIGLVALFISSKVRIGVLVWALLIIPPAYIGTRATGYWDGQNLVNLISDKFSEDRSLSLKFRFDNENILVEKALEKQAFGWGGWGRSRVYDEDGEDISVTDGFWIITLGRRGYFGLVSVTLMVFLPMLLFVMKCPPRRWSEPEYAPTAVLAIISLLFLIDCMLNAMVNQIYFIFAGGVSGMMAIHGTRLLEKPTTGDTDKKRLLQPGITTWIKRTYGKVYHQETTGIVRARVQTHRHFKLPLTQSKTSPEKEVMAVKMREVQKKAMDPGRVKHTPRPLRHPEVRGSQTRTGIGFRKHPATRFLTE